MRIGINGQILTSGRTGVTRFARNIIQAMPKVGASHEFVIFGNRNDISVKGENVTIVPTSPTLSSSSKRILWEQFTLPRLSKLWHIDAMYYPDYVAAIFDKSNRVVITFHDASPFAMPASFNVGRRYYKRIIMKASYRLADAIIAVSEATRMEIAKYFRTSGKNICVVYNGLEESLERIQDEKELARIQNSYRLSLPIILFVGTLEARKNILGLLRAFTQGKRIHHWPHTLVLVGPPGHGYREIEKTIRQARIQDFVTLPGYVKDEDLPTFYSLADVFVYPSFYEGFGFPPLEAMRCGCPVISSNATSLPEIVGDAGILIDPYRDDEITEAINRVLDDSVLNGNLRRKGIEHSRLFTWEKSAQGILAAITSH